MGGDLWELVGAILGHTAQRGVTAWGGVCSFGHWKVCHPSNGGGGGGGE